MNNEVLFSYLVDNARDHAVMFLDREGVIRYFNHGAELIFRCARKDVIGSTLLRFCTPEDRLIDVPRKEMEGAAARGCADDERWHLRADGTRFWANGFMSAARDHDGRLVGFTKVMRDQTTRKMTEDKLHGALAAMTEFTQNASHDLREPLRAIAGHLGLLAREMGEKIEPDLRESLGYALDGARRMKQLLDDLLSVTRLDRKMDFAPTDLNAVADLAISNLLPATEEAHGRVTRGNLPTIDGAETQLLQVLQNLVSNALKYRKPDVPPVVTIDALEEADIWRIDVADNGIGIPPEKAEAMFGAFTRLADRDVAGTGLGLFIVRRIIDRHNGRIWIESRGGDGTTVHFTLPKKSG